MILTWDGTTFNATGSNSPALPYTITLDQVGKIYRTTTGVGYLKLVYTKFVLNVEWVNADSAINTYLRGMNEYTGVIAVQCDAGTFNTKLVNFNLADNGYNQTNASLQLRQV